MAFCLAGCKETRRTISVNWLFVEDNLQEIYSIKEHFISQFSRMTTTLQMTNHMLPMLCIQTCSIIFRQLFMNKVFH